MLSLERLRDITVKACTVCSGSGILPDDSECNCSKEYKRFATLLIGHFPEEHISMIFKKTLGEVLIVEGAAALELALTRNYEFLERGMGIVIKDVSDKSKRSSVFLTSMVMDMLIRRPSLRCRYFDGCREAERDDYGAEILVLDTVRGLSPVEKARVEKLLVQRERKNLSNIVYVSGTELFLDWPTLGELISWNWNVEGGKLGESRIYKQINIKMVGGKSRWEI